MSALDEDTEVPARGASRDAEHAAMDAAQRLSFVTGQLPAILWTTDRDLIFTSAMGAGLAAIGRAPSDVVGTSLVDFVASSPDGWRYVAAHRAALDGRGSSTDVWFGGRAYQTRVDPLRDEGGAASGTIGVALDITDLVQSEEAVRQSEARFRTEGRAMEAKLIQAERLASMGTLAAGVAHEINNPLTYVMANVGFVSERLAKLARALGADGKAEAPALADAVARQVAELLEALSEAQEGAVRVRQIVRDLKVFSRGGEDHEGAVDVRQVLESSLSMAWNEIRHRARVVKDFAPIPLVQASESKLGQVFLNLLINAAQAIVEGNVSANEIRIATAVDDAGRVIVTIGDTGTGIAPEVAERIFDPFFTTKPLGVGTGLGLFICHGIVKGLGGDISVESEVGRGARFRIALPPASAAPPDVAPREVARDGAGDVRRRVLLIDDEVNLATGIERALGGEHDVVLATSGREAKAILATDDRFDVVLCDLMMPDVTGMEVFAYVTAERPHLTSRMVFMTGGAFTAGARTFLEQVTNPRIEKPFDLDRLRAFIRDFTRDFTRDLPP